MNPRALWNLLQQHPDIRRLWIAETASSFGDYFFWIAMMWLIYTRTGSGLATGLMSVSAVLPMVLLGPLFGVVSDRWNRKRMMQLANLLQALLAGLLAIALLYGMKTLWPLYVITALLETTNVVYRPARSGIFPDLVGPDQLLRANSLFSSSRQGARLIGSISGGLVMATFGPVPAIGFDAFMYVCAAFCITGISYRKPPVGPVDSKGPKRSQWQEFWLGWDWLRQHPMLLTLTAIGMLSNVALGPANVLAPMLIRTTLHSTAAGLGVFDAAIGVGIILGGLIIGSLSIQRVGLVFCCALGLEGLAMSVIAWAPNLPVADLGNLLFGIGLVLAEVPASTMHQRMVPGPMRGRVSSMTAMISGFAIPITYGGVGWFGDLVGARGSYLGAALLLACCMTLGFLVRQLRSFHMAGIEIPDTQLAGTKVGSNL